MNTSPRRPVAQLSAAARRLARAALDMDTDLVARLVQASVDDVGVASTWECLVQPVWFYLGTRPGDGSVAEQTFVRAAMSSLS